MPSCVKVDALHTGSLHYPVFCIKLCTAEKFSLFLRYFTLPDQFYTFWGRLSPIFPAPLRYIDHQNLLPWLFKWPTFIRCCKKLPQFYGDWGLFLCQTQYCLKGQLKLCTGCGVCDLQQRAWPQRSWPQLKAITSIKGRDPNKRSWQLPVWGWVISAMYIHIAMYIWVVIYMVMCGYAPHIHHQKVSSFNPTMMHTFISYTPDPILGTLRILAHQISVRVMSVCYS